MFGGARRDMLGVTGGRAWALQAAAVLERWNLEMVE